jgi:hypothetical protein
MDVDNLVVVKGNNIIESSYSSGRRTKRSKYPVKEFLKTQLSEIETLSLSFSFQT